MTTLPQKMLFLLLALVATPVSAVDYTPYFHPRVIDDNDWLGSKAFANIRFQHNQQQDNYFQGGDVDIVSLGLNPPLVYGRLSDQRLLRGELGLRRARSSISIPVYYQRSHDSVLGASRYSGFGVKWQHHINLANRLTVVARFGGNEYVSQPALATDNTQASIVWSGQWRGSYKPSLSGGFILGDDRPRFEQSYYLARRYYGFMVGGKMTLFDKHTPYISVSVLRNDYNYGDSALYPGRAQDYMRFSAGWNWQVSEKWKLRADTYYILGDTDSGFYNGERSRIMFSTEFNLR